MDSHWVLLRPPLFLLSASLWALSPPACPSVPPDIVTVPSVSVLHWQLFENVFQAKIHYYFLSRLASSLAIRTCFCCWEGVWTPSKFRVNPLLQTPAKKKKIKKWASFRVCFFFSLLEQMHSECTLQVFWWKRRNISRHCTSLKCETWSSLLC